MKSSSASSFVGRVTGHPAGFAFVNPLPPQKGAPPQSDPPPTVRVETDLLKGAAHGDIVSARVIRKTAKGFDGEVVKILEHVVERVVGRFESSRGSASVIPFDRRLFQAVSVASVAKELDVRNGDMVLLRITRRATGTRPAAGEIVERFGPIDEPGVDLKVVMAQHNLNAEFPEDVVRETEKLAKPLADSDPEITRRMDFRPWTTITIDPATAKDHDDAISVDLLPNGNYLLGVHIADVAYYVREGSALDACAYERGNSVYFPGFVVPMLPHSLSSGVCSLLDGVNRLTQTAVMEIDPTGRVIRSEFFDGVIRSAAKLSYSEAQAILDGDAATRKKYAHVVALVERSASLAKILNAARVTRGSLDFDLPEPLLEMDELGAVSAITATERLFAMRMIEEFMLAANEAVARALDAKKIATLYRIHETPDPDRVEEFGEAVQGLGLRLTADLENLAPADFQKILQRVAGKPEERLVAYLLLRTQRLARYDPENLGHFGLATPDYLHFTSPIRRYPDLVAHRALRALRHHGTPAATHWPLAEMADHLGETERRAADAERDLMDWKKMRFMASRVGDTFDGVIVSVQPFGLFVQLSDVFIEGLVHVSTMADDYYEFRDTDRALRGQNSGRVFKLGQKVTVQLIRVDLDRRQIHLALNSTSEQDSRSDGRRSRGKAGVAPPRRGPSRTPGAKTQAGNARIAPKKRKRP